MPSEPLPGLAGIKVGQAFRVQCLVRTHDVKVTGTGKAFVSAVLADVTGEVDAVQWDPGEVDVAAYQHDVVEVSGKAGTYKNRIQLTLDGIRVVPPEEADWARVLPTCPRSEESLVKQLDGYLSIVEAPLLGMVQQATSVPYFRSCPAASTMHHAYARGLFEHSVDVARLVVSMVGRGGFNASLAVAGALLHDIGKMYEYTMTGRRLPVAKTLGHSLIGCQVVASLGALHSVPQDLLNRLSHIVASHHGRREWGAVVEPVTNEAWVVHAADVVDAKLACGIDSEGE